MAANSLGSSEARDSWITSLNQLLRELKQVYPTARKVRHEAEARDEFLDLDAVLHDRDPPLNYAYFTRFHEQVHAFAWAIDDAVKLQESISLNEVFWTVALAAVEEAFSRGWAFDEFSGAYEHLNKEFPTFSFAELSQFPRSLPVQQCLQQIFSAYFRCYLQLIVSLNDDDEDAEFDPTPVLDEIRESVSKYESEVVSWKHECEIAQKEQDRRQRELGQSHLADEHGPKFETLKFLGAGSYGRVDVVREPGSGMVYARKSIPLAAGGQDPKAIEQRVKNEADIMSKLRHNHVASVNMLFRSPETWDIIMLPVADMDLRTFLEDKCIKQHYPAEMIKRIDPWFGCLISALAYAHDESVKHEDIKPSNILIAKGKIFLTDFGTAKDFSELEISAVSDYLEQGTPIYWAPEPRIWGRAADVFALGCVFSEMLTVRQHRSLTDFRQFRFNNQASGFGYAYKSNLPKVRQWLLHELGINNRDPTAQTILEQTLNMLVEESNQRSEARRLKRNMRADEQLFCNTCA